MHLKRKTDATNSNSSPSVRGHIKGEIVLFISNDLDNNKIKVQTHKSSTALTEHKANPSSPWRNVRDLDVFVPHLEDKINAYALAPNDTDFGVAKQRIMYDILLKHEYFTSADYEIVK